MVIERVFFRRTSDLIFKFFAFLQRWHPLYRQCDRDRLGLMMDAMHGAARQLAPVQPPRDYDHLVVFFPIYFIFSFVEFVMLPQ